MPQENQLQRDFGRRRLTVRRLAALLACLALISGSLFFSGAVYLWPLFIFPMMLAAIFFFELGSLVVVGWLGLFFTTWFGLKEPAGAQDVRNASVGLLAFLLAGLFLGRVQRRHHRLQTLLAASSLTDRLTGLYNYGTFVDYLHNEVTKAARYGGNLALVMFDLDHFKRFNDRYGHEAGNEMLRRVGAILRHQVRKADMAARYGGEEFAVLIRGDEYDGYELAERVRTAIESAGINLCDGSVVSATVSAGVAACRDGSLDETLFIERADAALYESKRRGRNRVTVHTVASDQEDLAATLTA